MNVSFHVEGEAALVEFMTGLDHDADRAHQTALRATGRRAASLAKTALAARFGIPKKIFSKRVAYFPRPPKTLGTRRVVLWGGRKVLPKGLDHPKVARQLLARIPGSFAVPLPSGSWVVTKTGRKLTTATLDITEAMDEAVPAAARQALNDRYVDVLVKDFTRRKNRRAKRG